MAGILCVCDWESRGESTHAPFKLTALSKDLSTKQREHNLNILLSSKDAFGFDSMRFIFTLTDKDAFLQMITQTGKTIGKFA